MSTNTYINKLKEALLKKEAIVVFANCEIWYHGKVESYLSDGDRIIVIKQDGVLIVHQPISVNPINYMKEETEHTVVEENGIFLKSKNVFSKEYMDIKFNRIYFVNSRLIDDSKDIIISGSEKDMSDMIFNNPEVIEEGFKPFSREEHTKFGFIDVFGRDRNGKIVIIECKRDFADFRAINQLHRYINKIMNSKGVGKEFIRGIIAAPRISENALIMMKEYGFEFKTIFPPKYLEKYDSHQKKLFDY